VSVVLSLSEDQLHVVLVLLCIRRTSKSKAIANNLIISEFAAPDEIISSISPELQPGDN